MPSHQETRILPYSAEQLFDLVMDIEKYPEFLPWCLGARINTRQKNEVSADVIVGYKMFRERFSSRVHYIRPNAIEVEYLKGPMRHLQNKWVFTNIRAGQCEVDFYVDFSLESKIFEKLVDQFFHKALVKMINAFEARAIALYGGKVH
ncbi:MAG TPA: type II toxin-antitoxin system RatA family toxin [Alphaproteobacteria bacterium]|nr:type II toxin-antitoxin system RatA family toxin [Alphaproteobacteria bacterium]